jgi:predicted PurR-regulated permease PerM
MDVRHTTISITTGTIIKAVLLLVLTWILFALRSIVLDLLTAIVIASAIEPGVASMYRRRIPRVISVLVIYASFFLIFFVIFYFFLPSLFTDMRVLFTALPNYIDTFLHDGILNTYASQLGVTIPSYSTQALIQSVQNVFSIGGIFNTAGSFFGNIFNGVIIFVFSFYFAVIDTGVDDFLRVVVPRSHQSYVLGLWRRSQHKIGLWMQGQLILALIMGVLVYLALTVIGVPNALLLAVITAVFEIIPVFGPTLAAIPAVAIAFASGGVTLGFLTTGFFVIAQQFENHLISPLVVTRVTGVPPLLVILAVIIGGSLAGFLGVVLSVPIAATIQEFVRDLDGGTFEKSFS